MAVVATQIAQSRFKFVTRLAQRPRSPGSAGFQPAKIGRSVIRRPSSSRAFPAKFTTYASTYAAIRRTSAACSSSPFAEALAPAWRDQGDSPMVSRLSAMPRPRFSTSSTNLGIRMTSAGFSGHPSPPVGGFPLPSPFLPKGIAGSRRSGTCFRRPSPLAEEFAFPSNP